MSRAFPVSMDAMDAKPRGATGPPQLELFGSNNPPRPAIFTVGYAGKGEEGFFQLLQSVGVERVADIRLWNRNPRHGYASRDRLQELVRERLGGAYLHLPELAPTGGMLSRSRAGKLSWPQYEERFLALLEKRNVAETLPVDLFDRPTVLLCVESAPAECHRRLVAEHLAERWGGQEIVHL